MQINMHIQIYSLLRTLTRHRRTSMFFCILEAQAICLVSVVFDRWVAHYYVCDYRFLARFWLIFHVWRTRLGSFDVLEATWEALGFYLRPKRKKLRKMSELWPQYGRLWAPWCPSCALWDALLRPRTAKRAPRSVQKTILVAS